MHILRKIMEQWPKTVQTKPENYSSRCRGDQSAFLVADPHCLSSSTVSVLINYYSTSILIDSASSCSYMNCKLARGLKLKINPCNHYITLAIPSKHVAIKNRCHVNITINDKEYPNTCLELLENLRGRILLSLDFHE